MSDCNLLQAQLLAEQVQSSGGAFDRAATLRYEAALMSAVHVHSAGTCMFIAWLLTPPLAQACPSFRTPSVEQGAAPQANGRAALGIRCQLQSEGRECLVRGIIRSGPAASAGIRNGDVILPLDDADSNNVTEQIKKVSPGSRTAIRFKHGSTREEVTLTIADELAICVRGAELRDPVAETSLAEIYENGEGVSQDYSQARKWYERAAADGSDDAALSLGKMYFEGKGAPKDDKVAVSWYRKAAEHGNVAAEAALGWMYVEGRGVAKDPITALQWYRKAAEQGDAESEATVADAYARGFGVPQDQYQAAQWFQKAAEAGIPYAQTELAIMYSKGSGVPGDQTIAMNWLRKAAAQDFAAAEYDLGVVYETGMGVPKDLNTAKTWYRKAADHGYADAKARLDQLKQ